MSAITPPLRQGELIKINFDPREGHEQAGYRPAVVVSNDFFNEKCGMTLVCPVTNTDNKYPLHVPLDARTSITGVVMCEHIRALDLAARPFTRAGAVPNDILQSILDIIHAEL